MLYVLLLSPSHNINHLQRIKKLLNYTILLGYSINIIQYV